jgi:hypothetical protein
MEQFAWFLQSQTAQRYHWMNLHEENSRLQWMEKQPVALTQGDVMIVH